jgi:hypothetical protein
VKGFSFKVVYRIYECVFRILTGKTVSFRNVSVILFDLLGADLSFPSKGPGFQVRP